MGYVPWSEVPAAKTESGPWQIYALLDPRDETVRYVGVTKNELPMRLCGHMAQPTNRGMKSWIAELFSAGLRPKIRLLIGVRYGWEDAERGWIAWFRARGMLLNMDPGGVCRDKRGRPIKRMMRPDGAYDVGKMSRRAKRKQRKANKAAAREAARDPWRRVRNTPAAIAAETSARQMRAGRDKDSVRAEQHDPAPRGGKLCPTRHYEPRGLGDSVESSCGAGLVIRRNSTPARQTVTE